MKSIMKFRIIEEGDHFVLQKKVLWWWVTETTFSCCPDGMAGDDEVRFSNEEEVMKYIYTTYPHIRVIKEFVYRQNKIN